MGIVKARHIAAALAFVGASAASAETLTVSGWYAAEEREASMLRVLAVDRFDGEDGPLLVTEIERELRGAQDQDRKPYFEIKSRYAKTDGVVHGDVRTLVDNVKFTRKAKRCPNDIYSTKCKEKEKISVDLKCIRRIVTVSVNAQITRLSDDDRIYSRNLPQRHESESCEGEKRSSDLDAVIATMVRKVADEFANQITPFARKEKIRVRESRSGMSKADSNQMKSLIAATKQSESAACAGWGDMEKRGVSHPTLRFNLGLCAESVGELEKALGYYGQLVTETRNAIDANDAITRIERRFAGEDDAAARNKATVKP